MPRIKILESVVPNPDFNLEGHYIVSYDANFHLPDGSYDGGWLLTTTSIEEATEFSLEEALAIWKSGPTCDCHRLRPDGEPNRPLTAFNVEISETRLI